MKTLRLIALFWRLNLRVMAQYPLNLTIWFMFGSLYHLASVGVVWAMLQRFSSLGGWTFPEMLFLYALWSLAHGVYAFTLGKVTAVSRLVREGLFDRILVRPLNPLLQVLLRPEGFTIDDLVIGIALFAVAQGQVGLSWTWERALILPATVLGAALIKGGLLLALAAASFWVVRMDAARLLLETVETEFARFPLTVFPRGAQWVLTFVVPFAFTSFLPAQLLLGKAPNGSEFGPAWGYLTPAVGLMTFGVAYMVWRLGLQRYQSTGS